MLRFLKRIKFWHISIISTLCTNCKDHAPLQKNIIETRVTQQWAMDIGDESWELATCKRTRSPLLLYIVFTMLSPEKELNTQLYLTLLIIITSTWILIVHFMKLVHPKTNVDCKLHCMSLWVVVMLTMILSTPVYYLQMQFWLGTRNLQTIYKQFLMIMQRVGDWHCPLQSAWFRFLHRFQTTTRGSPFGKSAYLVPIPLNKT